MKALNRNNLEQVCQYLSCQLIIVTIKFLDASFLHLLNKSNSTFVFDFIILKLQLLQCCTFFHQDANQFSPYVSNMVISQYDSLKLLLLFLSQRFNNNLDSSVRYVVSSQIQNSDSLAILEDCFEFFNTGKSNIVSFQNQNFEVRLLQMFNVASFSSILLLFDF